MKRFVCYTLEGLRNEAGLETWMPLGSFGDEAAAVAAASVASGYAVTRILPNFRVSGFEVREAARPRLFRSERPLFTAPIADSVPA